MVPVYVWDSTRWAVLCADPALFSLDPEPIFQKSFFFRSKKLQIIGYMDLSIYCTKCTYFCFKCKGLNQSRPGKKSFGSFFAFMFPPVTDPDLQSQIQTDPGGQYGSIQAPSVSCLEHRYTNRLKFPFYIPRSSRRKESLEFDHIASGTADEDRTHPHKKFKFWK